MLTKQYFLLLTLLVFLGGCKTQAAKPKLPSESSISVSIDTTLTKYLCLTMEGDSALVKYHIQVTSWNQPVRWSMDITSKGKRILSYSSLDTAIDEFFRDTTYLFDCTNYIDCKKKWYLDRITRCAIDTIKTSDNRRGNLEHHSNEYFDKFFKDFSIRVTDSKSLYHDYWSTYSNKDIISFEFFFAPEGWNTPSLAYYSKESIFIPIYSE